jgi:hypothetical protein
MARRSKGIPTAALAVIVALAAYWYWSPLLTVHRMKEAVRAHDAVAFNSHVDFPALRENMRDQISGKPGEGAFDRIGRILGGVAVDALLQPEAVMYVLEHGDFAKKRGAGPEDGSDGEGERKTPWTTEREGVNRYVVRNDKVALVLVRNGFADWKLSEIRL